MTDEQQLEVMLDVQIGHSVCPEDETDETCKIKAICKDINTLIANEVRKAIGEDEPLEEEFAGVITNVRGWPKKEIRNQLRAEQRKRAGL